MFHFHDYGRKSNLPTPRVFHVQFSFRFREAYSLDRCYTLPTLPSPQEETTMMGGSGHHFPNLSTLLGNNTSFSQGIFKDEMPFPKVGYVSFLKGFFKGRFEVLFHCLS